MGERVFVFPATGDCSESEQSILSGNSADMCMQGLVGPVPEGEGWTMEGVQGGGSEPRAAALFTVLSLWKQLPESHHQGLGGAQVKSGEALEL